MRWGDYQLNRLETVFAVIVLLVILSAILNRAVTYFSIAERALVTNTITNINTALRLQEAAYHASGQSEKVADLAGSNPVKLISARPQNYTTLLDTNSRKQVLAEEKTNSQPISGYLGEIDEPQPSEYARGSWYYDNGNGYLVYMVRNRELFSTPLDGPERIRLRIGLDYKDRNNNGRYDKATDQLNGVKLEQVDDYQWLL